MERIEVNIQTGEVQTIQLTPEEIVTAQTQYAAWEAKQAANPPAVDLQTQISALTAEINALKLKVGE